VLFDLDGTLLDTVADIAQALNGALRAQELGSLTVEEVRGFIGRGVQVLIERALARLGAPAARAGRVLADFEAQHARLEQRGELSARVYPGVAAGLAALHAAGLPLALVTNKPARAARDLLSARKLAPWIAAVVGGDSGLPRKPHPDPLLAACGQLGVAPAHALMVGDSRVDVEAARAAGLLVVCVPYGYNEGSDPRALPADAIIESIAELPGLLGLAR